MINIALLASGGGSNVDVILQKLPIACEKHNIVLGNIIIITNNPKAGVIQVAAKHNKTIEIIKLAKNNEAEDVINYCGILQKHHVHFVVLAGYLKKIPVELVSLFPNKIVNIHPALLPKYGGNGMYGKHVHNAVIAAKESITGITIHYVDDQYDHGATIMQQFCEILPADNADDIAKKVLALEHEHYTAAIVACLQKI
jgi:phosphoribosylglycinamide formyltransferase 1